MGRKRTKAQKAASEKYMKKMKTLRFVVPIEKADEYKKAAEEKGFSSLSKFIVDCIEKRME